MLLSIKLNTGDSMYLPESAQIRSFLNRELQKHFSPKLVNIPERIRLVADLEKYRLEDPYFVDQHKGKIPRHYSLYFDNEYVCGFDSTYFPQAILLLFWRGLTRLYQEKKIYLDKSLYRAEEEIVDYEKKEKKRLRKQKIDKLNAPSEVKEVIRLLDKEAEETKGQKR